MQNTNTATCIKDSIHQAGSKRGTGEDDKMSVVSIVCRICYDTDKEEPIITPCQCKGTVAFVHCSCLETWLAESNTTSCELCHHTFITERTPKYSAKESLYRWFRYPHSNLSFPVRGLRSDFLACTILTPLAIMITYVCLFSADYYSQKRFENVPAAKWTSLSLLVMISIMLIGYYLWVFMVIRYHSRIWYYCWQRECVVKLITPSITSVCTHRIPLLSNNDGSITSCNGASRNITKRESFAEKSSEYVLVDINEFPMALASSHSTNKPFCSVKCKVVNNTSQTENPREGTSQGLLRPADQTESVSIENEVLNKKSSDQLQKE